MYSTHSVPEDTVLTQALITLGLESYNRLLSISKCLALSII